MQSAGQGFPEAGSKTGICTSGLILARGKTCSSGEAKGLDPKAEHAHLCVCGGLDWAGERLRREVAHHNRESTRLREVTIAAVSGDRDTHRSTSIRSHLNGNMLFTPMLDNSS